MGETCPVCRAPIRETDTCCSQCGFKLLGATQRFVPIALNGDDSEDSDVKHSAAFRVVRGPQTGVTYELVDDEITIGRNPQCTIFLNDMTVSRKHASLKREKNSYVITDENSYNGIWVNNQNVQTKTLTSGDFVQIGTFCLLYEES